MRNGTFRTRKNHLDTDFILTHRMGAATTSDIQFPDTLLTDAGLIMDDQETADYEFTPPTPAMPFGCTDFSQAGITTNLTGTIHDPLTLDNVTHANASGGYDIRQSILAAINLGWFKTFYNVTASGALDWFDTFRLAQLMGSNAGETRSITWGTPWFTSWEQAALNGQSIMPMPTDDELNVAQQQNGLLGAIHKIRYFLHKKYFGGTIGVIPWHDSILDGFSNQFKVAPGTLLYRDESHQGKNVGDGGFLYFSREVVNAVMSVSGTVAFTPSNQAPSSPISVPLSTLEWILSIVQNLLQDLTGKV